MCRAFVFYLAPRAAARPPPRRSPAAAAVVSFWRLRQLIRLAARLFLQTNKRMKNKEAHAENTPTLGSSSLELTVNSPIFFSLLNVEGLTQKNAAGAQIPRNCRNQQTLGKKAQSEERLTERVRMAAMAENASCSVVQKKGYGPLGLHQFT